MGTANIAFGYVGARYSRDQAPLFSQSGDAENLTTSTSATTSNISAPAGSVDNYGRELSVRIMLDEIGYVRVGGTAAAVGTGLKCQPDVEYYFSVNQGDTVSVIDAA